MCRVLIVALLICFPGCATHGSPAVSSHSGCDPAVADMTAQETDAGEAADDPGVWKTAARHGESAASYLLVPVAVVLSVPTWIGIMFFTDATM